jgi:hypothetical protein
LDDWVSADDLANAAYKRHHGNAGETICQHALSGLIVAKAHLVILHTRRGELRFNDVKLPPGFWWAEGKGVMDCNWRAGQFTTTVREATSAWNETEILELASSPDRFRWSNDMRVQAFRTFFEREGAALLCPELAAPPEPEGKPLSGGEEQRFFAALKIIRNQWTEQAAQAALKGLFPGKSMPRAKLRIGLRSAGLNKDGPGKPGNSPESETAE